MFIQVTFIGADKNPVYFNPDQILFVRPSGSGSYIRVNNDYYITVESPEQIMEMINGSQVEVES